eukprot:CAMPEP_0177172692 /NCGR_PEP_ID=MMETSP0367-20130122/11271_1 /TAXON_ID=447022 ORGANISM="Scrippsiella hangoei-like, Strain SHHI-4" /NCGR_SAMPLE_ID=MMETSP0367 /ASSEMBLY_ACC=CAM_ASM_000362 /LENGTH=375 /DNA_ID=CAMNT_0018618981 /DNA_START=53 /DNA_END=1180 /DNA_ORIENTATION=-
MAAPSGCPFAQIVKATAPVVAPHVRDIVDDFYPRMMKNNPETKAFFNPANQLEDPPKQRMALANAVVAYASNIDDLTPLLGAVEIISHKHCALRVAPEHYPIVHDNLMASIAEKLGAAVTPEVGKGWSEAVLALADILIQTEKKLHDQAADRSGGWRGAKDFKVSAVRMITEDCAEVTFVPADDSSTPIDFTAGQFLTLHLKQEGATPRHYTVTSAPGKPFLQCCVKKLKGGFVSNLVHNFKEGDVVGLSPPFGTFAMGEKPAVLISAGIGATPMKAFLDVHKSKVKMAMHVDKSEATHPFRQEFLDSGVSTHFHYTSQDGRPTAEDLVKLVEPHIADCDFYLCGPDSFLASMKTALTSAGASGVHVDVFGPALA